MLFYLRLRILSTVRRFAWCYDLYHSSLVKIFKKMLLDLNDEKVRKKFERYDKKIKRFELSLRKIWGLQEVYKLKCTHDWKFYFNVRRTIDLFRDIRNSHSETQVFQNFFLIRASQVRAKFKITQPKYQYLQKIFSFYS